MPSRYDCTFFVTSSSAFLGVFFPYRALLTSFRSWPTAAVYDSTSYAGQSGWFQVGGTSLASPLIAGVFALAGGTASYANAQEVPYANATNWHDVTNGSNGSCGTIMCN